jgi:hypothetical protein
MKINKMSIPVHMYTICNIIRYANPFQDRTLHAGAPK